MFWRKVLGLLLCLTASVLGHSPARAADVQRFLLLYSNNVHGETEPCG